MGVAWNELDNEIHYYRFPLSGISASRSREVTTAGVSRYPVLAHTGSALGMAWADDRDAPGRTEIYYALLDEDGFKLTSEVRVTSASGNPSLPSLAWTGSEFGLAWHDSRDGNPEIYFARLATDGTPAGPQVRITNDVEFSLNADLEWTGSEFGVAWTEERDGNEEIYFTRLSATGAVVGSEVRVTTDVATSDHPSLAWTGSEFGLSWADMRDSDEEIYFVRLSSTGTLVGADSRITSSTGESSLPFLMWADGVFGLTWQDQRDGNLEIYFVRLEADSTVSSYQLRLTARTVASVLPVMAWTGSEFGIFWTERVSTSEMYVYAGYVQFCE
jgi:hypothetical protein